VKDSPRNGRPVSRRVTRAAVTTSIDQSSLKSVRERSAEPGVELEHVCPQEEGSGS
jgi:hypothetical protein